MVRGLDKFREYFKGFPDAYVIIGGTACELVLGEAGLTARATKDIDIILVIEALSKEFVSRFWEFIKAGKYERNEQNEAGRKYYRFVKPESDGFPLQLELFSKQPDILTIPDGVHLTPIPVDDDLSSLSAILMNDDYYQHTLTNSIVQDEIKRATTESLICLKACAHLDLKSRKDNGEKIDDKNIKKHKNDVFRLALLLGGKQIHELPETIRANLTTFVGVVKDDLPDKDFFKDIGAGTVDPKALLKTLVDKFNLSVEIS